jgi:hypothetical protein
LDDGPGLVMEPSQPKSGGKKGIGTWRLWTFIGALGLTAYITNLSTGGAAVNLLIGWYQYFFYKVEVQGPESMQITYDPEQKTLSLSPLLIFKNPRTTIETVKAIGGYFGVLGDEAGSARVDSDSVVFKDGEHIFGSTTNLNPNSGLSITAQIILKVGATLSKVLGNSTTSRELVLNLEISNHERLSHLPFDFGRDLQSSLLDAIQKKKRIVFNVALKSFTQK